MRIRHKGFSLVELCLTMLLFFIIGALGVMTMRHGTHDAYAKAMATELSTQLRLAQAKAIATQTPVAVVIPSEGGTTPCSQSVYVATGTSVAKPTQSIQYGGTYPEAAAFVGYWGLSGGGPVTVTPPASSKASFLDLNKWLTTSMKKDYCFVFTPDGGVVTNGLPNFSGAYHILVASGVSYTGAASPSGTAPVTTKPAYFMPTFTGQCWTITLNANGAITMEFGVAGQDGSVKVGESCQTSGLAPGVTIAPAAAAAPSLVNVALAPQPDPNGLPANTNIFVNPGGHISIVTNATDPNGNDLFVKWTADGGTFSYTDEVKMSWDQTNQVWTSTWQWQAPPPGTVIPGQMFHLTCSIRNSLNALAPIPGALTQNIQIAPPGHIVLTNTPTVEYPNTWSKSIWMEFAAGAGLRELIPEGPTWLFPPFAAISKDGQKIAFSRDVFATGIHIADQMGNELVNIPGARVCPAMNPSGTQVAYWHVNPVDSGGTGYSLCKANADGTNEQVVWHTDNQSWYWNTPSWSPDGQQLAFYAETSTPVGYGATSVATSTGTLGAYSNNNYSLHVIGADGTGFTDLGRPSMLSSWGPSPTNPQVYFVNGTTWGGGDGEIYAVAPTAGGTPVKITNLGGLHAEDVSVAPDGAHLIFTATQQSTKPGSNGSTTTSMQQIFQWDMNSQTYTQITTGGGQLGTWGQ